MSNLGWLLFPAARRRNLIECRREAAGWFLLLQEIPLVHAHRHATTPSPAIPPLEPDGTEEPPLHDTAQTAKKGLWMRTGLAGQTCTPELSAGLAGKPRITRVIGQ